MLYIFPCLVLQECNCKFALFFRGNLLWWRNRVPGGSVCIAQLMACLSHVWPTLVFNVFLIQENIRL